MKLLIGCIIGIIAIAGVGYTYDVSRAAYTENIVDVRIVEVGGHEYVVAASCTPNRSSPLSTTHASNKMQAFSSSFAACGGSSVAIIHHVGCRACAISK